jgi:hypothetical protein
VHVVPGRPGPSSGISIAGFVTGLLGLVGFWFAFLSLALCVCGIVLSAIGLSRARRTGASTALALTGLVFAGIGLIPSVFVIVLLASY